MDKSFKIDKWVLLAYMFFLNPIVINNYATICYAFIYGIPLVYLLFNPSFLQSFVRFIPLNVFRIIVSCLILLLFSIIVPSILGTWDLSYVNVVLAIARKLLILLFLAALTIKFHANSNVDHLLFYYSIATALYVLGTCIFIAFPALKNGWQNILGSNEYIENLYTAYGYGARFGWSGFSGYRNTLDCTLSIVFLLTLRANDSKLIKNKVLFYSTISLCFLGNMFYGRTGIVASSICIIIGAIYLRRFRFKHVIIVIIIVTILIGLIVFLKNRVPLIHDWFVWATTPFINLFTTGSFNNYSATHILEDMIFNPNLSTWIHGDGYYTERLSGLHYMHTDVGFMRQLLFWGAGGVLLSYLTTLYSFFLVKQYHRILSWCLAIVLILFEIKGEVYYELLPIALIITLWLFHSNKQALITNNMIKE